jgi:hypothetical protein
MSFVDKAGMKVAPGRLQEAVIAPREAKPIEYDTAATPGNTTGTGPFPLTDKALYFGTHSFHISRTRVPIYEEGLLWAQQHGGLIHGQRISFDELRVTKVERNGNSSIYELYDKSRTLFVRLDVRTCRRSFGEKFLALGTER